LTKAGYTIVDPGPYEDGTTDYSAQIALLKTSSARSSTPSRSRPTSSRSGGRRRSKAMRGG